MIELKWDANLIFLKILVKSDIQPLAILHTSTTSGEAFSSCF